MWAGQLGTKACSTHNAKGPDKPDRGRDSQAGKTGPRIPQPGSGGGLQGYIQLALYPAFGHIAVGLDIGRQPVAVAAIGRGWPLQVPVLPLLAHLGKALGPLLISLGRLVTSLAAIAQEFTADGGRCPFQALGNAADRFTCCQCSGDFFSLSHGQCQTRPLSRWRLDTLGAFYAASLRGHRAWPAPQRREHVPRGGHVLRLCLVAPTF